MTNSVQLKHVFNEGRSHAFYGAQIFLGMISILLSSIIGKINNCLYFSYYFLSEWVKFCKKGFLCFLNLFDSLDKSPFVIRLRWRILGVIQLYTFLFTSLDYLPAQLSPTSSASTIINYNRFESILLVVLPALTALLFLFDTIFLIMLMFWNNFLWKKNHMIKRQFHCHSVFIYS